MWPTSRLYEGGAERCPPRQQIEAAVLSSPCRNVARRCGFKPTKETIGVWSVYESPTQIDDRRDPLAAIARLLLCRFLFLTALGTLLGTVLCRFVS